jgi:hypothetical protein
MRPDPESIAVLQRGRTLCPSHDDMELTCQKLLLLPRHAGRDGCLKEILAYRHR